MPYTVQRLPSEPIIVVSWSNPTDSAKDSLKMSAEVDALIAPDENHIYCVQDFRNLKVDFSSMVTGMATQREKRPGAAGDPRLRTIMVGSGLLWELASKGAKQLQYGGLDIPLFSSVDDAVAYARTKVKDW
jgi:hypothetical protein